METAMAYHRLKQIFPGHQLENINLQQLTRSTLDQLLTKSIPHIPLEQLHSLCRAQQKNVMEKVMEVKQMDLYDEIAHVCPNKDLKLMRSLSNEEVNQKIHHYSSQMAQASEKDMMDSTDQSDDGLMEIQEIDLHHHAAHFNSTSLRNIFEEYDQNFSWNDLNIYDLH